LFWNSKRAVGGRGRSRRKFLYTVNPSEERREGLKRKWTKKGLLEEGGGWVFLYTRKEKGRQHLQRKQSIKGKKKGIEAC